MQTQADISNVEVVRPGCVETTALGAAYLAGLGTGFWKDEDDIESSGVDHDSFIPAIDDNERSARIAGWNAAVSVLL